MKDKLFTQLLFLIIFVTPIILVGFMDRDAEWFWIWILFIVMNWKDEPL